MPSVTKRIKGITQPKGGYLNPKSFKEIQLETKHLLNEGENIAASLVGLAVDYLTRFSLGSSPQEAFKISLIGADLIDESDDANALLSKMKGLDDMSIINASKLVGYDVIYRAGRAGYKPVSEINPDLKTIENIRMLVQRSLDFFESYGPIVLDGFTFEGAYTNTITIGDGDFLTKDTLWDFKVSVAPPTKDHTLQLLVYFLMGRKSIHKEIFEKIRYLGIYNPRLNKIYRIDVNLIPKEIIEGVSRFVIGY